MDFTYDVDIHGGFSFTAGDGRSPAFREPGRSLQFRKVSLGSSVNILKRIRKKEKRKIIKIIVKKERGEI